MGLYIWRAKRKPERTQVYNADERLASEINRTKKEQSLIETCQKLLDVTLTLLERIAERIRRSIEKTVIFHILLGFG